MMMTDEELLAVLQRELKILEDENELLISDIKYLTKKDLIVYCQRLLIENELELNMLRNNVADLMSLMAATPKK